jgi:hypothetical protein
MDELAKCEREENMNLKKNVWAALAASTILAAPTLAMADTTTYVPEDEIKQNEAEASLGEGRLDGTFGLSASFSLASNRNVVGQTDGFSMLFGVGVVGGLDYLKGKYEMRNTLKINEAFSRTPVIDEFIKTNDIVEIENLHNYFLKKWFGVFGRVDARSNLFATEDVRADPVTYVEVDADGNRTTIATEDRLTLNGPLAPLSFAESIGVFVEPVRKPRFSISARVGGGARQTVADGVRVIQDDDATEEIEVTNLDNVFQAGAEAFVGIRGRSKDKRVTYDAGVSTMIPFLNNDPQDRTAIELTRTAAEAQLTFGMFEWLNLVYNSQLINDPQLIEGVQFQNNLVLTFQYTFVERSQAKPTDPSEIEKAQKAAAAAEAKAKNAEKRAEEAEKAAEEAKQRAEEAEKKLAEEKKAEEAKKEEEKTPETPEAPESPDSPEEPAPTP